LLYRYKKFLANQELVRTLMFSSQNVNT